MYIVQVASECAPVVKAGGLGDVVFGLSRELENQGHIVDIILPKYDCMRYDHIWGLHEEYNDLWVPWGGGSIHCTVFGGKVHGRNCFFIEPHSNENFFNRGNYYGNNDDNLRFAFFSRAALEYMCVSSKRPEIIHCHDWQTGLLPVMLFEQYKYRGMDRQRVCYTIHNFKHQGGGGVNILGAIQLDNHGYYLSPDRLKDTSIPNHINFMKSGIVYSNAVNTVSPHHAWEARFGSEGYGLGHTLYVHEDKFRGILNGLDYKIWNPEVDEYIPMPFGPDDFELKAYNKKGLRERLWLEEKDRPIIAYVGRLDDQKGVGLVHHALEYALRRSAQFVLLGSATSDAIKNLFWQIKHRLNDHPDVHLELSFDEELSHLIYAGADMMVVPSNYEPCGLTQMISLKYGTVPIVRGVGGLVNTVFDYDYDENHPPEERNGFVFYQTDVTALESAMHRALELWYTDRKGFNKLAVQGMRCDYSWRNSVKSYVEVYEKIKAE
ncbi:glycogen synthase GlgA [Crocosphaera chwakensis]|uniref:Glycogen synthase n=1 Tax=Crocosphaera chwakensis CCY0110 TaxID=391612 RepID=A3IT02_9CHRO|nr:glycogen synthase GlgA [Crocosphaera chwakensis]EAZ90433.1 glycogen synthase [Crocosphaera chwakensis CCY0110]